jgi:hypothetical protein
MARPPEQQWWTINGDDLMTALWRAHEGDDPGVVYLEMFANSDAEDYGEGEA